MTSDTEGHLENGEYLAASEFPAGETGCVDVGWILVENLDALDKQAIRAACEKLQSLLTNLFPEFQWRLSMETHEVVEPRFRQQPVTYLEWALAQRDLRGWDFVLIFVSADLQAVWQPQAWAAVSRSLDSAVISTARIDPRSQDTAASENERCEALSQRVETLVMRSLGHLIGLDDIVEPSNYMHAAETLSDLDSASELTDAQLETMRKNLRRIADLRLEEEESPERFSQWVFFLRAGWRNRHEILDGLRQARPWQIPLRLAKLTMASLSTMVILMMTAEAWDLATTQSTAHVVALSLAAIIGTTTYVMIRQRLLLRQKRRLTEQIVTTRLTALAIVLAGIATTYSGLFVLTLLMTLTFFRARLISAWAGTMSESVGLEHYLIFAAFVSAIGILIGAMGASFEGQQYFRHVTLIDEEL